MTAAGIKCEACKGRGELPDPAFTQCPLCLGTGIEPPLRARIVTTFVHPPIPDRRFDWCAVRDGYEGPTFFSDGSIESHGDPAGYGRTEAEAIADLIESEDA